MGSSTEHSAYGPTGNPWALDRVPGGQQRRVRPRRRGLPRRPSASAPTPAAPSASPRRLTGIVGIKPTYGRVSRYGIVAFASSLDQIGPFARDARDAAALLHAVAGRDERDTRAPRSRSRTTSSTCRAATTRRPPGCAGSASGCRASTSCPAWSPAWRRASARPWRRSRPPGRPSRTSASRTPSTASPRTTSSPRPRRREPRPLRRRAVRVQRPRRGRLPRELPGDARPGLRSGGQAPDHARHVRAVGRLLRRVLPQGPEGPDPHQGDFDRLWEQGIDAIVAPTSPDRGVPVRRPHGGPGADVPLRRVHAARRTWPACPGISIPCGLADGLPVGLQLIGAPWSEAELFRASRAYEGVTATADWRRVEPRDLALLEDPATPSPAERVTASMA
jgi:aspartyl-tRNA(Asn)/glutamyl-tRNA(Gln) amidotransferase subunit A